MDLAPLAFAGERAVAWDAVAASLRA
jgi:hypothetical protein